MPARPRATYRWVELPPPEQAPAWFSIGSTVLDTLNGIATTGMRLSTGRLDGTSPSNLIEGYPNPLPLGLDRAAPPAVAMATDESVRFTFDDGRSSWMQEIEVTTGNVVDSLEFEDVIAASVADPVSGDAFVMMRDRSSLRSTGLWRRHGDGVLALVFGPDSAFDPDPGLGERAWLSLTPSRDVVVRWVCAGDACRADGIDLATSARRFLTLGLDFGLVLGVSNRTTVVTGLPTEIRKDCLARATGSLQAACPIGFIDNETGVVTLGSSYCDDDAVVADLDPLVVVLAQSHPACGAPTYELVAVDVASGSESSIDIPDGDLQLVPESADQGLTLDGGFVAAPDGDFALVPKADGIVIVTLPD